MQDIINYIESIKDLDILVVGETIIDTYEYGKVLGKSGKSPVVTFQGEKEESYDGGILAIRNHLKGFCKFVDTYTWGNIITKKRFIQDKQKLFETYSYSRKFPCPPGKDIEEYDLVLIADFGHGFLIEDIITMLEDRANYIALNTQNNSGNMGMNTINKYSKWSYASIDEIELRLACSNQFEDIQLLLHAKFNGTDKIVSVTENKNGSYVYKNEKIIRTPAFAKEIVDTVGAGDAYLALTSPLAYLGAPAEIIGYVGNVAGAIACGWEGNKEYITKKKLYEFMEKTSL